MSEQTRCERCGRPACDGCPLCCHEHPQHAEVWRYPGCPCAATPPARTDTGDNGGTGVGT